jgi:hypothetical protein
MRVSTLYVFQLLSTYNCSHLTAEDRLVVSRMGKRGRCAKFVSQRNLCPTVCTCIPVDMLICAHIIENTPMIDAIAHHRLDRHM